jgi:Flp pilus assembly protein TadG
MAQLASSTPIPRHRQCGQGLVEFAILLPIALLILISILDFGRAIYAYSVIANCAREGARHGIILAEDEEGITLADKEEIEAVVQNAAVGIDLSQLTINVTEPIADTIRVEADYVFQLINPLVARAVGSSSVVLNTRATMYTGY